METETEKKKRHKRAKDTPGPSRKKVYRQRRRLTRHGVRVAATKAQLPIELKTRLAQEPAPVEPTLEELRAKSSGEKVPWPADVERLHDLENPLGIEFPELDTRNLPKVLCTRRVTGVRGLELRAVADCGIGLFTDRPQAAGVVLARYAGRMTLEDPKADAAYTVQLKNKSKEGAVVYVDAERS
ncbi:hypothetical protein P43SY_011640 [Pythium insidiosum]|uniref:Uncharacterized protein n=1 Tax=Pythium insidiosum TaxID=114742 RepID=A0AAD5Q565_PYTIN|nr:hypothetical protein P43SY_011640 [Pythium insidiosum]